MTAKKTFVTKNPKTCEPDHDLLWRPAHEREDTGRSVTEATARLRGSAAQGPRHRPSVGSGTQASEVAR